MGILSRYFLASFLTLFVATLVASIIIIIVVEMLLNFDEMVSYKDGPLGIASYLFVRVPSYYLRDLIPVSAFIGAFLCLGLPARWSEITALKAGGIAPQRIAIPLLLAATVLSAAALLINETLVLGAFRQWNHMNSPGREITFRRGSFWYHRGDVIYNVREADRETRTLHGVRVFELSPGGRLQRSIWAEQVRIEDRNWHFIDATFRSFDAANPQAPPTVEQSNEIVLEVARERDMALLEASAGTLSLVDLREYIDARSREGRNIGRYEGLLQTRLAEPMTVFLLTLLAIPVGLAVDQNRNIAVAALKGIVLVGAFYTVKTIAAILTASGTSGMTASPWIVLGIFATYGGWTLARSPR